jgi:hypothetical protein
VFPPAIGDAMKISQTTPVDKIAFSCWSVHCRSTILLSTKITLVSKNASNADYWFMSGAGVCDGNGGYEFFTVEQIQWSGRIENCVQVAELRMINSQGSQLLFHNVEMEVFLPWVNEDEVGCGRTTAPSTFLPIPPSILPSPSPTTLPVDSTLDNTDDPDLQGNKDGPEEKVEDEGSGSDPNSDNENFVLFTTGSQQASSGLPSEALVGIVCGVLLGVLLLVNICFLYVYCGNRTKRLGYGSVLIDDPPGTKVTVEDLGEGMVIVKKVIPLPNGSEVIQKTTYPDELSAKEALIGTFSHNVRSFLALQCDPVF